MITPFKGGIRVTQDFGLRPEYYAQFGLKGHEGTDMVPTDADWNMYAIEDGEVVRDIDNAGSGGAYGITIVILNREKRRSWWYCHLTENYVKAGQQVKRGDKIGKMGSTGNTQGAHLHLGLRDSDANGNAININNGYKGFINPRPIVKQLNEADGQVPTPPIADEDKKFSGYWRTLQKSKYGNGVWYEPKDVEMFFEERNKRITALEQANATLQKKYDTLQQAADETANKKVADLKAKIVSYVNGL